MTPIQEYKMTIIASFVRTYFLKKSDMLVNDTNNITWIPFQIDIASHFKPLHNPFLDVYASFFGSSETSAFGAGA